MKTTLLTLTLALTGILAAQIPAFAAPAENAATMPDFTKGATLAKDAPHDWALGPTGARGWIHTANGHSRDARQILVTAVATGSPAAAVLSTGVSTSTNNRSLKNLRIVAIILERARNAFLTSGFIIKSR